MSQNILKIVRYIEIADIQFQRTFHLSTVNFTLNTLKKLLEDGRKGFNLNDTILLYTLYLNI